MINSVLRVASLALLAVLLIRGGASCAYPPPTHQGCLSLGNAITVCAASDMARITRTGAIALEHSDYDLTSGLVLHTAKNETTAFQFILNSKPTAKPVKVRLDRGAWQPATLNTTALNTTTLNNTTLTTTAASNTTLNNTAASSTATITQSLYQAHYHFVDKGGYSWGPSTDVLPWPAYYPDALIPQQQGCLGDNVTLFDTIEVDATLRQNQSLWLDNYVPAEQPPGTYTQVITLSTDESTLQIPVTLKVYNAVLPQRPSIDAVGEIYRAYRLEGVGNNRESTQWQRMSWCYQQLAHQHRMVFFERTPDLPSDNGYYDRTYAPILDGTLFSERYGYQGTGARTPVTIWRTPWPQQYDIQIDTAMPPEVKRRYQTLAQDWRSRVLKNQWFDTNYFAYVFDEVDGPSIFADDPTRRYDYLTTVHNDMDEVQQSIDAGSADIPIDLLWTSHSNPTQWTDDPALDLRGKVRLWAPNASAADPDFLAQQANKGDTTWFYHSGHPAIGAHSINNSGIEMRTWGVTGARYGIKGQFMWAVNLGSDDRPFAEPSYRPDDDRFGNGVMVYPGNQLHRAGFRPTPGPLPSMRLKAWRRGLQDAELFLLAKKRNPKAATTLIESMIPVALADATGSAAWSDNPADWITFQKALLQLAAGTSVSP